MAELWYRAFLCALIDCTWADMKDPNTRRDFYHEVNTAVAAYKHDVMENDAPPPVDSQVGQTFNAKPHFKRVLGIFRSLKG